MSRDQLKANTVNDPKFYIGVVAFLLSAGAMVASVAVAYSRLNTKLDNLDGVRDRVIKVETKVDNQEARISSLEAYAGNELRWRQPK